MIVTCEITIGNWTFKRNSEGKSEKSVGKAMAHQLKKLKLKIQDVVSRMQIYNPKNQRILDIRYYCVNGLWSGDVMCYSLRNDIKPAGLIFDKLEEQEDVTRIVYDYSKFLTE